MLPFETQSNVMYSYDRFTLYLNRWKADFGSLSFCTIPTVKMRREVERGRRKDVRRKMKDGGHGGTGDGLVGDEIRNTYQISTAR